MSAEVLILNGPEKGSKVPVHEDQAFTFGRVEGNNIRLDGKTISRKHASIRFEKGDFVITDLGSKNRTRINGEPITEKVLSDGDEIQIGSHIMQFSSGEGGVAVEDTDADDETGTQFVDMSALMSGRSDEPVEEDSGDGTEVVNMAALIQPTPEPKKSKKRKKAKPAPAPRPKPRPAPAAEEPDEGERTDVIDVAKFVGKSTRGGPAPRPKKKEDDGPRNVPQNVSFAKTDEGGNIEEGTDLLNMDDILDDQAPKVREFRPVHLAFGAGGVLVVMLIAMVMMQLTTRRVTPETKELRVGENQVFRITTPVSNPLLPRAQMMRIEPDPDILILDYFLRTGDEISQTFTYHFAIQPLLSDKTIMLLEFQSGDMTKITFDVKESRRETFAGTREELIELARETLETAEDFWLKKNESESLRKAFLEFGKAYRIMSQIEFGNLLPEFEQAKKGVEMASEEIQDRRARLEGQLTLAKQANNERRSIDILQQMIELRLGDNDIKYLKDKTILEFQFNTPVPD